MTNSLDYKGKKVLLLDGYGRQIPSLLRQLHQLGCIVTTVNHSKLDVGYTSRYADKRIVAKGIRDDRALLKKVIDEAIASGKFDIIFPVLEPSTDIVSQYVEDGTLGNIKALCAPREAFLKAYDKQQTMKVCMENGIPCPITKLDDETLEEYLKKVDFPLAAKPRKGSGGAGFKRINNREELDNYLADGTIKVEEYVIQELIPAGGFQYGGYVMMDENHKPQSTLIVESCRWFPIDGGPGCYIRTINHQGMINSSNRLLEKMNWINFGHIGFIMDPRDNTPKVMEINGRIPASIRICEWAGTKPVKNMLDLAYGKKIVKMTNPIPEHLALRYFHTDVLWFVKNPNRFKTKPSWFNFFNQKDYIFSWSDPIPFFSYGIEHLLTYKEDMGKRKH